MVGCLCTDQAECYVMTDSILVEMLSLSSPRVTANSELAYKNILGRLLY